MLKSVFKLLDRVILDELPTVRNLGANLSPIVPIYVVSVYPNKLVIVRIKTSVSISLNILYTVQMNFSLQTEGLYVLQSAPL